MGAFDNICICISNIRCVVFDLNIAMATLNLFHYIIFSNAGLLLVQGEALGVIGVYTTFQLSLFDEHNYCIYIVY